MKRFVILLVPVLTAVAILGAFPAIVRADDDDDGVPFNGSAGLTVENGGTLLVGTGHGTPLGDFTLDIYPDIDGGRFSAKVVITTSFHGDQIFKTAKGTITSNGTTTTFTGTYKIHGGTGRFEDATGGGDVVMVLRNKTGTIALTYDGTIEF